MACFWLVLQSWTARSSLGLEGVKLEDGQLEGTDFVLTVDYGGVQQLLKYGLIQPQNKLAFCGITPFVRQGFLLLPRASFSTRFEAPLVMDWLE